MITASGNIPRFLADTLPDAYAEVIERRARLAADLERANESVDFLRRVAIAAGVDLDAARPPAPRLDEVVA